MEKLVANSHQWRGGSALELQVRPMGVVVGGQSLGVGNLNMRVIHLNAWRDEDEVNLLALERRDVAEVMESIGGAGMIGRHVVSIKEFTI